LRVAIISEVTRLGGHTVKIDGAKLRRARELRGFSLEKAGKEAGVTETTVWRLEHGYTAFPSTARKIADALGVSTADLVPDEVDESKASAPGADQLSFPDLLGEDRRGPTLEQIKAEFAPLAGALDSLCARWEQRLAAGEVDGAAARFFVEDAQHLSTHFTTALKSELEALAVPLRLAEEGHPYHTLERDAAVGFTRGDVEEKSLLHPALQRYSALVAQLEQFAGEVAATEQTPTTAA
jgi:transcriptional regulator with XRE-family HTH domain